MTPGEVEALVERALAAGAAAEQARQAMNGHARDRRGVIAVLHRDAGLSVRAIARRLGYSPAVVRAALVAARP